MGIPEVALLLSGFALVISLASFWVNSLAPFSLRVTNDAPTLSVYTITPKISGTEDGATWWIPSINVGLSFFNAGRRPGQILDVRILADHTLPLSKKHHAFYPKWIVDYSRFNKDRTERFKWLDGAVVRDWYPFFLGGHSDIHIHLIFELEDVRWDKKFEGILECTLQYISTQEDEWIDLGKYDLYLSNDLFEESCSFTGTDEKIKKLRKL